MWIALAFYGVLALAALWACWPNHDLRFCAFALIGSFLASNAVWFFGTLSLRPSVYSLCEVVVMVAALMAWKTGGYRSLIALVVVSIFSICANVGFASIKEPRWENLHIYEVLTNLCFAAECLIVVGTGIADGIRTHRFRAGALGWRGGSQPHGARRGKAP